MFTIKHVTPDGESLHECTSVTLDKSECKTSSGMGVLMVHMTDGMTGSFDRGTVYVMNRDGRTISTYHFEGPSQPPRP